MSSPCMKKDTVNTTHSTPACNGHVASLRLSLSNLTSQLLSTEKLFASATKTTKIKTKKVDIDWSLVNKLSAKMMVLVEMKAEMEMTLHICLYNTPLTSLVHVRIPLDVLQVIFSFLRLKKRKVLCNIRWCCKLFSDQLPLPSGLWTTFPHPNYQKYPTLEKLMNRLNELHSLTLLVLPASAVELPTYLFLRNGVYKIKVYKNEKNKECNYLDVNLPLTIIGESRDNCIIMGGLNLHGQKTEDIFIECVTICNSKYCGILGWNGMNCKMTNVKINSCEGNGVVVRNTKRNSMINCEICNSGFSGLYVHGAKMTISGPKTKIHSNGTKDRKYDYGLDAFTWSSIIHVIFPLSKESISTNNNEDRNYKANGIIVTTKGTDGIHY